MAKTLERSLMRIFNYPEAERHPFGAHGILIALPIATALWVGIIVTVF
jgi:hypothetical protein